MKLTISITLESDMTPQEAAALTQKVSEQTSVIESAVTLMNGLHSALVAAQGDPAALQAVIDQLGANTQGLADAVAANTPAVPPA